MSFAVESKFKTQEEKLDVLERNQNWFIGMPLAPRDETRIPLVPSAVRVLTARGYKVMIESKAGKKAGFSDQEYSENGATVAYSKHELYHADIILQCFPPSLSSLEYMKSDQMLISPLHVGSTNLELIEGMRKKRVVGMAMEYMK